MTINIDIYLKFEDKYYRKGCRFSTLSPFNGAEDAAKYTYIYIKQFKRKHENKRIEINKVIYEETIDITAEVQRLSRNGKLYLVK
ncbi:hypothetical protein P9D39_24420 [Heyndrickxia oleronia]|uniref:Uncharacterized protein n=1 Tax=Heyndrickxia oleronia TaxID=38875 RepID=A0A8E2I6D9_9BACI|nr:hypothetical protein [Heyndrickxia oleronia]MEC1377375.1 hypothetical protein [Heyndrickxia oleronia]OOP67556.1 hypothetical protein BWZ43_15245 [Heyndrickxia oleronia]QQZ06014.1 hypothetical protein I5818_06045 [Heyndrickxia oleronia]